MAAPQEITPNQLVRLIGTSNCPTIVDVQIEEDFAADPYLIPTAIRHSHNDIESLGQLLRGKRVVVYCQKGLKLSQGAVSWLRSEGIEAEYLHGGMVEWAAHSMPRIPAIKIPTSKSGNKPWVTRHRPKIDRIACPWLIQRFVDPQARFLFVSPSQVLNVAEKFNATPFDIEGEFWSHREDACSFDTMLDEFELRTPALDRMSKIIRAADTSNMETVPEAAGLLAISVGLSREFKDDHEQLQAGLKVYDALYRWARDGSDETHSWPHGAKP